MVTAPPAPLSGGEVGCACQVLPSQVQVLPGMPYSTSDRLPASYAMRRPGKLCGLVPPPGAATGPNASRDGDAAGCSRVQRAPSQVHVSPRAVVSSALPPNMTATPRAGSYTMAAPLRAAGAWGGPAGCA